MPKTPDSIFLAPFRADIQQQLTAELTRLGDSVPECTFEELLRRYYNSVIRYPRPRPRKVHWSTKLYSDMASAAMRRDLHAGIFWTALEIQRGESLLPRLSRAFARGSFDKKDGLLYDWNINHLHIGLSRNQQGLYMGSDDILFAVFRQDDAYLVSLGTHTDWHQVELVEIVHRDWPHLLAGTRVQGVTAMDLDQATLARIRKKGANVALQVSDGTVYSGIGGGLNASGGSIAGVRWADYIDHSIRQVAEKFEAGGFLTLGTIEPSRQAVRVVCENDCLVVYISDSDSEEPPRSVVCHRL